MRALSSHGIRGFPGPAAVYLFGYRLLGMIGIARSKKEA
jgi:hypothetical protein